ncbi:hypothetical protein Syun_000747 [Stephania yunnanensis]|uniref:Protein DETOXIFICATION n=1 Tax=Stephania yunnanensis TaxID=152371 RepID=A0AAP0Q5L8_9MAGN
MLRSKLIKNKEGEEEEGESEEVSLKEKVWEETKKMWVVAGPAIFTRFSTFGITVISQAFIGHIGSTELAAYALVQTVLLRFANGILLGMASALETLCGQAYGARQHHMLGIYLQRSWLVLIFTALLLSPVFVFASPLLKLLGQDQAIAEMGGVIGAWFVPVIFAFIVSFTCQMYLQAQSKNMIIAYLAAASLGLHIFLSWLLTVRFKFGLTGALGSTVLAYWVPNVGQLLFVFCGGVLRLGRGSLGWRLGICGLLSSCLSLLVLCSGQCLTHTPSLPSSSFGYQIYREALKSLELWYNSVLVLLTGNLKDAEVEIDAISICLNINGWEMMISLGFLAAASVRVSNELGRGSKKAAKFSVVMVVLTSLSIGSVLFLCFLFLRGNLAYIFTNNPDVVKAVARLSPFLAISILFNSVQPVLSGVAVGAGWQGIVAYVNIACYYIVGIPLGGIWIGMLVGTAVQTLVLIIITWTTDWDKQVILAQQRVRKWFLPETQRSNSHPELA